MPMSEQESRCVDMTCAYLDQTRGGTWRMDSGPILDEQFPNSPSPEAIVGNGLSTAAIEVKRLTGDSAWQEYTESLDSLKKFLAPSCGGYYDLIPAVDFRLPAGKRFKKLLRAEIERVAPSLAPGDKAPLRIPRRAVIRPITRAGPGYIYCSHADALVASFSPRLTGKYWLDDTGQWEHEFSTDLGREAFFREIEAACGKSVSSETPLEWQEEWELIRSENADTGVWIVAVTQAGDFHSAVQEAVEVVVDKALAKFARRRWADQHIVTLERMHNFLTAERVREVMAQFDSSELASLDLVLLVDGVQIDSVWP